nr:protein CLEC16A [Oncorhynchus nerka]
MDTTQVERGVFSLVCPEQSEDRKINPQVSLNLLSQVFLIIHYQPLVNSLAEVIFNGDLSVFTQHKTTVSAGVRRFTKPPESLERSLELSCNRGRKRAQKRPNYKNLGEEEEEEERPGGGEEGLEDSEREREKAKGTEGSSKGSSRTSGEMEGECEDRTEELHIPSPPCDYLTQEPVRQWSSSPNCHPPGIKFIKMRQ